MPNLVGFFMSRIHRRYDKPVLNIEEQLELLNHRGLVVTNPDRARHYLRFIGYYRFAGYFPPFLIPRHPDRIFKENVTFDLILEVYVFDRKLRLLAMDAVERIEVAIRTTISQAMGEKYGPHWYLKSELFKTNFNHKDLIEKIELETGYRKFKKQNDSTKEYFKTYKKPYLPPGWVIAEVLPIGTWSYIFRNLRARKDRKKIGDQYGLHFNILSSWLHSFTYLRNLCAHHSRLWNRKFTVKPVIAKKFKDHLSDNATFYAQAVVLNVFLSVIADGSRWQYRLLDLLKSNQNIPVERMGFHKNWHEDPFWRITE